ncbi:MAG: class I SAM-dependent methyltransferase [Pseudomonadota bacterium]
MGKQENPEASYPAALLEGHTDANYLQEHGPRFLVTHQLAQQNWCWPTAAVLDIGAHWLHQAVLYAADGHQVTAVDRQGTMSDPGVQATAQRHNIALLENAELADPIGLNSLADDSIDVVLFCEVLEHLTFNPVNLWRAIYRVLKPGGRIILTTPNYYAAGSLVRGVWRQLRMHGAGASVQEIIGVPTSGPHWKEYSRSELVEYFRLLSGDFVVGKARYVHFVNGRSPAWKQRLAAAPGWVLPPLRNSLYLEIDLPAKMAGVCGDPAW